MEQERAEGQVAGVGGEGEEGFALDEGHEQQVGLAGLVPEHAFAVNPGGVACRDSEAAFLERSSDAVLSLHRGWRESCGPVVP